MLAVCERITDCRSVDYATIRSVLCNEMNRKCFDLVTAQSTQVNER